MYMYIHCNKESCACLGNLIFFISGWGRKWGRRIELMVQLILHCELAQEPSGSIGHSCKHPIASFFIYYNPLATWLLGPTTLTLLNQLSHLMIKKDLMLKIAHFGFVLECDSPQPVVCPAYTAEGLGCKCGSVMLTHTNTHNLLYSDSMHVITYAYPTR